MGGISIIGLGGMARVLGTRAIKAEVSAFITSLGLRPLHTGPLEMARRLEETGLLMMGLGRHGVKNHDFALGVVLPR